MPQQQPREPRATPFYQGSCATLYLGDCREVFAGLDRLDAGLVATDPPYGVRWRSGLRSVPFAQMAGDDGGTDWPAVIGEIVRRHLANSRHVYLFGYSVAQAAEAMYLSATAELIWDKGQHGSGALDVPWGPAHEQIVFGVYDWSKVNRAKGRGGLAARMRRGSVLRHDRPNSGGVRHPSEKPVSLMRELVESSTVPGDLVLDPCAGSGSTLVAAVLEGRRACGVECEPRWAEMAAQRLAAAEQLVAQMQAL
jgi:hypothetical protein